MKKQAQSQKVNKTCKCCGTHVETSFNWEINELGLWADCTCGSTLLIPVKTNDQTKPDRKNTLRVVG